MMNKMTLTVAVAVALALSTGASAQRSAEDEVIAVVNAVFEGMAKGDTEALRSIMMERSELLAVGSRGPRWTRGMNFAGQFSGGDEPVIERMWDPVVMIDGPIAMLWAPYDLYVGERFSHCGTDAFQLALTDEGWKVAFISYTAKQPPECERHPEGPPGR